jgi:hypothetical protein
MATHSSDKNKALPIAETPSISSLLSLSTSLSRSGGEIDALLRERCWRERERERERERRPRLSS